MARIRSIKPEFWSSEQVMSCSRDARLVFIGLWNFADDAGRCPNSAKTIKAQILPGDDDVASENIRRWIDELASKRLVQIYEVDGRSLLQITGWNHQKIDKPRPSKYPPSPIVDHSSNGSRALATDLTLSNPNGPDLKAVDGVSKIVGSLATALPTGALREPTLRRGSPSGLPTSELTGIIKSKGWA